MATPLLKMTNSKPNISQTVTNTKNGQLQKFLRILSSLPKCLKFLRPILRKLEFANFRKFQ